MNLKFILLSLFIDITNIRSSLGDITMKRNKLIALGIGALTSLIIAGCASAPNPDMPNSPFTSGQVSMTLKKGVTTKAEVLETFGSPNIVTQDSSGNSVWTYQKNATISESGGNSMYWTVILVGGQSGTGGIMSSQKTMTLILTFDGNIVSNFKSLTTNF